MKKSSHFARMTAMVNMAMENAPPPEERPANQVIQENVIAIDPAKCRMNDLHRRLKSSIESGVLDEMVEQFKTVGQVIPARGWKLNRPTEDGIEVILIFGARRRAAAEKAGIPLRVEIVEEPARTALIRQMHAENSSRKDYLPLEQGMEFKAFLDSGEVKHRDELALMLGIDRSRLTRCLQIAEMPAEVLAAYRNPSDLQLIPGSKLATLIESNAATRQKVIKAAQKWVAENGEGNPTSKLMAAASERKAPAKVDHDLVSSTRTSQGKLTASPDGAMVLRLNKTAPEALREEILKVLKKHFSGLPS